MTTPESLSVHEAFRRACMAMDAASPDGAQIPRGPAGLALVEEVHLLGMACADEPQFRRLVSEPLLHLYPYEVTDALGWTTAPTA